MEKVKDLCESQLVSCQQLVKKYPKVELLKKAESAVQSSLDKLTSATDELEGEILGTILSNFTQSCLDSTYHQECQLVDKEFLEHTSSTEVQQIIETLSRPLTLCLLLGSEVSRLGTEVIECLHWRVGALLYMYSHMVLTVEERKKNVDVEYFKKALCVGVGHLNLMLCTRAPLKKEEDYVSHDATVPALLQKGIFSDLHMLSLMYAGEMCHWYWELSSTPHRQSATPSTTLTSSDNPYTSSGTPSTPLTQPPLSTTSTSDENPIPDTKEASVNSSEKVSGEPRSLVSAESRDEGQASAVSSGSEPSLWIAMELTQGIEFARQWAAKFDPQKFGIEFLSKYIDVARGPLKEQSWNYTKAVQLLVSMRKATLK